MGAPKGDWQAAAPHPQSKFKKKNIDIVNTTVLNVLRDSPPPQPKSATETMLMSSSLEFWKIK
jgi:hypothetical protein